MRVRLFVAVVRKTVTACVWIWKVPLGKFVPLGVLVIWFGVAELHDQPLSPATTAGTNPKPLFLGGVRGVKLFV